MSVGRNELCPCGSGKKYKKCCGIVTTIAEARNLREEKLRRELNAGMERLNKFVAAHVTAEELQAARERFASAVGIAEEETLGSEWFLHFLNWYTFDLEKNGTREIDRFLQQHGRKIEPEIRRELEQLRIGAYEVEQAGKVAVRVRELAADEACDLLLPPGVEAQPGEILLGRMVSLGQRGTLLPGSMILKPVLKAPIMELLRKNPREERSALTLDLYRLIVQAGVRRESGQEPLVRRLYRGVELPELRSVLEAHHDFELKKRDGQREIWVYSKRKEAHLFPALRNALLELHEVGGEVLVEGGTLAVEAPPARAEEMASALALPQAYEETPINQLTSTGARLTPGTLFITSEPMLPSKVLQWAVQTYFAEKWLTTPHQALDGQPPILAAASAEPTLHQALADLVKTMEEEGKRGQGVARFMRIDALRPRLGLANDALHIGNLLRRPLIEGAPESGFAVAPETLADIAAFVTEMTEGKTEATVKKYDEAMNLFRSFVRAAFGPAFAWEKLQTEEVAYFLVHDVPQRTESLTKTLAGNLLSVLAAFFKWVDKRANTERADVMQPLLTALKDDLAAAYRLRAMLQKEAHLNLAEHRAGLQETVEEHLVLLERRPHGWLGRRSSGEHLELHMPEEAAEALAADWIVFGLFGRTADGCWRLLGTPWLYPPEVSRMLGVPTAVLV
ncbi:SEC-C domain-containing protein [Brevibacillus sp. SYP-B805]|uniref:SEC-C metal-binding domain-containing protein n=1 Tax=Brevibacillus sp. SYP-B805 TaxID=1578199 RepID=UPI0013ECA320|nr:SEC-C metal-binding domain-containing protein [Brevibacillus sp. SYP-B805]NGQ95371.1 SEC-C domain-containing protein [Brevibacillus sp. SYP-B805]